MTATWMRAAAAPAVIGLLLTGCGGSAPGPPSRAELAAVRAVMASRQAASIAWQFSRTPGAAPCVIQGGGPPPGVRVPGRCETAVRIGGDRVALVRLVETWDGRDFRGPGSTRRPRLAHTWEFTVTPGGRVYGPLTYGDFPPQLVK